MTIAEFIRLRPAPDDDQENPGRRNFVCELPDVEEEHSDAWLDCGRVTALASHGRIRRLDVVLNDAFMSQLDAGDYSVEDVLGVIVLCVGWEAKWSPMERVSIHLRDGRQTLDCIYKSATSRVSCIRVSL